MPNPFDDLPDAKPADPFSDLPAAKSPFDDLPDSGETVARRIDSDVFYNPTIEEFRTYRDAKANEPSRPWAAFKQGVSGVMSSIGELAKGLATSGYQGRSVGDAVQSMVEASGRGLFDTAIAFRPLVDRLQSDDTKNQFLFDRFNEAYPGQFKPKRYSVGGGVLPPNAQRNVFELPESVPADVREKWEKEFDSYKLGRDFERFNTIRELQQIRETARQGKGDIVTHDFGTPNQQIAEGGALFADPTTIATMAASGVASKATAGVGRSAVSKTLEAGGKAAEGVGSAVTKVAELPERAVGATVRAATANPEMADKAQKAVAKGRTVVALGEAGGLRIPYVTEAAQAALSTKVAGEAVKGAGQAVAAAGRAAASPSRFGALARIAQDSAAPQWLRRAASSAVVLDPAFRQFAGITADVGRGAASGAAVGAGIGAVTGGDVQSAAAGAGGGLALGAIKGALPNRGNRVQRTSEERSADIANFLSRRTPGEVDAIGRMRIDENQMLRFVDLEGQARTVTPSGGRGDIRIRFLSPEEFVAQHPKSRPQSAVPFETTEVHVNTGYKGKRPLFADINRAIEIQRKRKPKPLAKPKK